MVGTTPVDPYPHPAFPEALLPDAVKAQLQKNSKPHYPQRFLEKIKPLDSPANDVRQPQLAHSRIPYSSRLSLQPEKLFYASQVALEDSLSRLLLINLTCASTP